MEDLRLDLEPLGFWPSANRFAFTLFMKKVSTVRMYVFHLIMIDFWLNYFSGLRKGRAGDSSCICVMSRRHRWRWASAANATQQRSNTAASSASAETTTHHHVQRCCLHVTDLICQRCSKQRFFSSANLVRWKVYRTIRRQTNCGRSIRGRQNQLFTSDISANWL